MTAPITTGRRLPTWRAVAGRGLVIAVTALVGFLLVGQLRSTQRFTQPLEAETEGDLARILASLETEADALRDERDALRLQLIDLQTSTERDDAATKAAEDQLRSLAVLAGTVPVVGPGVVVQIEDPKGRVGYDGLIDVVQELRDAGAEAIAVNNRRIGAASAFGERDTRITLDGTTLSTPYRIAAIGQPSTLDGGLQIPGGAIDTISAVDGAKINVQRQATLTLPALAQLPSFRSARPVGSGE